MNYQLTNQIPTNNLSQAVSQLSTSLDLIKPTNYSKEIQLITYTLLSTAIVGIFVYHYINNQEHAISY